MYILGFPLLLVPFAIYNIVAFIFHLPPEFWTTPAVVVPLTSSQIWKPTWEDTLVTLSIFLFWIEVVKSTKIGARAVVDHLLAILLFAAMLAEFILIKSAATSTFFLMLVIGLVDVLAGFVFGIRSAPPQIEIESSAKP